MVENSLSERKEDILIVVIQSYLATGMPVGSRAVSDNHKLGLSPATIRNEMAELEEIGYLNQPYTSAGRIPTDKGYRYYVDCLMRIKRITKKEIERIEREYIAERKKLESAVTLEEIMGRVSQALSNLTNYTGLALFPEIRNDKCNRKKRLCLEGIWHILNYPEFHDIDSIKKMFEAFEKEYQIREILNEDIEQEGIHIRIGSENKYCELHNCSLVTSRYGDEDEVKGSLGIIGPVRMDYKRVVPIVSFLAETITRILSDG